MAEFTEIPTEVYDNMTEVEWESSISRSGPVTPSIVPAPVVPYVHRLVAAVIMSIFSLIGILGNGLVIVSVLLSKRVRTTTNILVVNLAVADFMFSCSLPLEVMGLVDQSGTYPLPDIICVGVAGSFLVSITVSVLSLPSIAIVRWYVITKSVRGHQGLNRPFAIGIIITGIWIIALSTTIVPPIFGVGILGYYKYLSLCVLKGRKALLLPDFLILTNMIAVCLSLTILFYVMILVFVLTQTRKFRQVVKRVESPSASGEDGSSKGAQASINIALSRREIEITKNLFIVVCIFVTCFFPTFVLFLIPGNNVFIIYGAVLSMANSSLNPITYGLKHPNFQDIFRKIVTRQFTLIPEPSDFLKSFTQSSYI